MAILILVLFCTLIQFTVFPYMAIPARNVISVFVRIDTECVRVPDSIYFEKYRLREFFLRIILHTIGNGDTVTFYIDKNVGIVTATFFCIEVKNILELRQGNRFTLFANDKIRDAIFNAIIFTDFPIVIDNGIGHKLTTMVFFLVLVCGFCYQNPFEVIEPAAKAKNLLFVVKFYPYLLAFVFRHCRVIRISQCIRR